MGQGVMSATPPQVSESKSQVKEFREVSDVPKEVKQMEASKPVANEEVKAQRAEIKPQRPAAAPSKDKDARDTQDIVVSVDQVIARRGSISVSGRYTCSRQLHQDYASDNKVVGTGMSGSVQLVTGRHDGRKYAVKSLRKKGLSSSRRAELKSETEIYLSLDHPHIARLEMVYETDEELHLVMEYMEGGELYERLAAEKQYTERAAAETTHQMLLALAYLHANQIAHRDLKLENFLYERKDSDHLKLIDFGFAKFWHHSTKMSQACGSLHYVAPEVLAHSYTGQADLWSLGVIVYMLLVGSPPFSGTENEVLKKIRTGNPHYSSRFRRLSEPAQKFVQALLVKDPTQRLTAHRALEHPWVKKCRDPTVFNAPVIDSAIVQSLRSFAHASRFRRAVLSMMAWSLSAEDRAQLREQFLHLDVQKRGTISMESLKAVLEDKFEIEPDEAEELSRSLDIAAVNGEIEYSEFMAAALLGRVKVHEDVLRKTWARFDRNESGLISADDLRASLGGSFAGADVAELIVEADTSGDGMIDYEEFLAYFHNSDPEAEPTYKRSERRSRTEKLGAAIDRLIASPEPGLTTPTSGVGVPSTPANFVMESDHAPQQPHMQQQPVPLLHTPDVGTGSCPIEPMASATRQHRRRLTSRAQAAQASNSSEMVMTTTISDASSIEGPMAHTTSGDAPAPKSAECVRNTAKASIGPQLHQQRQQPTLAHAAETGDVVPPVAWSEGAPPTPAITVAAAAHTQNSAAAATAATNDKQKAVDGAPRLAHQVPALLGAARAQAGRTLADDEIRSPKLAAQRRAMGMPAPKADVEQERASPRPRALPTLLTAFHSEGGSR